MLSSLVSEHDQYSWLRDAEWPEVKDLKVLDFLKARNEECNHFFEPLSDVQNQIFEELKGRIKEDDKTVPIKIDDYYYYSYINKGSQYWVHAREHDNKEQILLDENLEAQSSNFFRVINHEVSSNHKYLAYCEDRKGDERYTIKVKDLITNQLLSDAIENTFGEVVWHENNEGFFYIPANEYWRPEKVMYHKLDTPVEEDRLIYHEKDSTFRVSIARTSSKQYFCIETAASNSNETYCIDMMGQDFNLKLLSTRRDDHLYYVTHHKDDFYILTNDRGKNFRLVKTPVDAEQNEWQEIIPTSQDIYLTGVVAYKDNIVLSKKKLGLPEADIINLRNNQVHPVSFKDPAYTARVIFTTYDSPALRYVYSSLNCPNTIYEIDFQSFETKTLKVQEIPSGYNPEDYVVERIWAPSSNEVNVPISVVYNKQNFKKDGSNPLYLYGYGSYGIAIPPSFRSWVISLMDRGFVFAIAHIRGGDDLGFEWYESAKFLTKKKTFEDFIACAEHLIDRNYTAKNNIVISGGSAGGLLLGYCINARPDLYRAAVMHVPFVDVLNTMLDDSLPLTPFEFKEWGNPKQPEYYEYIKSYSPYDNIKEQNYPHIFITSGLSDPRVTYWEPAKFWAKLSEFRKNNNFLLLKTDMDSGHAGKLGRFDQLKEVAEECTFILKAFDLV